jgi:hypothetical protein
MSGRYRISAKKSFPSLESLPLTPITSSWMIFSASAKAGRSLRKSTEIEDEVSSISAIRCPFFVVLTSTTIPMTVHSSCRYRVLLVSASMGMAPARARIMPPSRLYRSRK